MFVRLAAANGVDWDTLITATSVVHETTNVFRRLSGPWVLPAFLAS